MQDHRFRFRFARLTVKFARASPQRRLSWSIDIVICLPVALLLLGAPLLV